MSSLFYVFQGSQWCLHTGFRHWSVCIDLIPTALPEVTLYIMLELGLRHRSALLASVASDSCLIYDLIKAGLFGYYLNCVGLFYASKLPCLLVFLCVPFIVLVYFYIVLKKKKKERMKKKFQYVFFPSG